MSISAYRKLRDRALAEQAEVVVMDEGSYRYLGPLSGVTKVVISSKEKHNFPNCRVFPRLSDFARSMIISEGCDNVLIVGESLYDAAPVYGARQL